MVHTHSLPRVEVRQAVAIGVERDRLATATAGISHSELAARLTKAPSACWIQSSLWAVHVPLTRSDSTHICQAGRRH